MRDLTPFPLSAPTGDRIHSVPCFRCISTTGRSFIFACLLSLSCAWASAAQARDDATGRDPLAAAAEELPLLDAGTALKLARKWLDEGQPQQAFELLRRVMQAAKAEGGIDTANIRFLAAQALLKMGRPAQAALILGQLAAERPELNRVRLDYAAALFTLGHDEQAETLFRELRRREGLPAPVRRNVEGFLERLRARQRFQVNFDIGFWRDSNVNHAPEQDTVQVPIFGGLEFELDEQAVEAWVARTGLNLRWRHTPLLGGRAFFETRAGLARNTAINADEHNRTWLNLSSGPRWRYAMNLAGQRRHGTVRADIGAERRWRGGDGYAASGWARLGLEQTLNRRWSAGASARVWQTRYDRLDRDLDPFGQSVELNLTRRLGLGYLQAGARLAQELTDRRNLQWQGWGTSLDYATILGQNWNLKAQAYIDERYYEGIYTFFGESRKDRTLLASLTVSHRAIALAGYLPELTVGWTQTNSTIPLYDRKNRIMMLGLRRLF